MNNPRTTETSQCVLCGGRLRNAVFCPVCGRTSCSWACYMRHLAQHSKRTGRTASHQSDARCGEWQEPADGQAVAG
jgi:hypothetical protein